MSLLWRTTVALIFIVGAGGLLFLQVSRSRPRSAPEEVTLRIIVVNSQDEARRVVERLEKGRPLPPWRRNCLSVPRPTTGSARNDGPLSAAS